MILGISDYKYYPILGFKGAFNSKSIISYLKKLRFVLSNTGRNENSNANTHKSKKVYKFLADSKMHMIAIPVYNPWLNPVETMIGAFKRKLWTMKRLD